MLSLVGGLWGQRGRDLMSASEARLQGFLVIWAATALLHRLAFSSWIHSPLGWLATAGSILLVFAPSSRVALGFFLAANVVYLFDILPYVANHLLFESILNLTLLLVFTGCCLRARGAALFATHFVSLSSPVVRAQLLLLYAFAVLHKLNFDFFDPAVSCAPEMLRETLALRLPLVTLPAWTEMPAVYLTIFSEAAIALLLWIRRTRHYGVAFGLVFHGLLALHPNVGIYSFTAMLYGLYFLFLSDPAARVLQRILDKPLTPYWVVTVFVAFTVWQQVAVEGMDAYSARFRQSEIGFLCWMAFSLAIVVGYGISLWRSRKTEPTPEGEVASGTRAPRLLWLMLIPVLLSGVSPYIGGKTQGTFSMFSNLRTEGQSNHLFLRRFDLLPYQSDVVTVNRTNHFGLAQMASRGESLTYFEFRQIASTTQGDLLIDYLRNGREHSLRSRDDGDSEVFSRHPWWTRKFLAFRRLPDSEAPMPCVW